MVIVKFAESHKFQYIFKEFRLIFKSRKFMRAYSRIDRNISILEHC